MKPLIALLIAGSALALNLIAAPTPSPTPKPRRELISIGKPTPIPSKRLPGPRRIISPSSPTPAANSSPKGPTQTKPFFIPSTPTPTPKLGGSDWGKNLKKNPPPSPSPSPALPLTDQQLSDLAKALKKQKTPTPSPTPNQLTDEQKKALDELLKKKTPTPSPTPKQLTDEQKKAFDELLKKKVTPTPSPTIDPAFFKKLPPLIIPVSPTPTPKGKLHIDPATPTPFKKIIPPFQLVTPTATPTATTKVGPGLQYAPPTPGPGKETPNNDKHAGGPDIWLNLDVAPPPPAQLGPPLIIPKMPHSIPPSVVNIVPGGVAPIPDNYTPPTPETHADASQTALRAWNGQDAEQQRTFDQTRVKLAAAQDETMAWQFYWKTPGPQAEAARWEVATVPFVGGYTQFPPAGLVAYGDASADADSPLSENFFSVDFASFAKNFIEGEAPKKYYMRVVPVDIDGNPVGTPSNFVRVDLP